MVKVFAIILVLLSLVSICYGGQGGVGGDKGIDPNGVKSAKSVAVKVPTPKPDQGIGDIGQDIQAKRAIISEKTAAIFADYVNENGFVDYQNLRFKRLVLIYAAREIDNLHHVEFMSWSQNQKKAFWINTYNLFTLKMVVEEYPIQQVLYMKLFYPFASIRHIVGGRTKKYFKVRNLEYTIDEIEELLQRFNDPRVNFALSYASHSSALLRNEAYDPLRIDQQLNDQVRRYLASPNGMQISRSSKIVYLSDIFNWNKESFIKKYGSIKKFRDRQPNIQAYLSFITSTVSAADQKRLFISQEDAKFLETQKYEIKFLKYNWRLNDRVKKKRD